MKKKEGEIDNRITLSRVLEGEKRKEESRYQERERKMERESEGEKQCEIKIEITWTRPWARTLLSGATAGQISCVHPVLDARAQAGTVPGDCVSCWVSEEGPEALGEYLVYSGRQ